jgi:DNA-binding transcriptional ArsR family regulator
MSEIYPAIDSYTVKKAALILRAVNHQLRQRMLKVIDEKGRITVTELYVALELEQSVASQHLAILRKAGFVNTHRDGKYIHYSVNDEKIQQLSVFVKQLLG